MHGPIEAPQEYVDSAHCKGVTTEGKRNVYCGMMACLDEGIGNLTDTYKALGIWQDTLLVLATDNGGHVGSSGNNAPLRGEKVRWCRPAHCLRHACFSTKPAHPLAHSPALSPTDSPTHPPEHQL